MNLTSRPYKPSDAAIITYWIKDEHLLKVFTALDIIMPHPVYAWMGWVCVLNPSAETFERLKSLIVEAYEYAKEKFKKRT